MSFIKIKYAFCHENAHQPYQTHEGDSCVDLYTVEDIVLAPRTRTLVRTGLRFEIPKGYEMMIRPRSGITAKTKITVHIGTIDSGYRGEVKIIAENTSNYPISLPSGYKLAQAAIQEVPPYVFVECEQHELSISSRDINGFGSTGDKK